MIIKVNRQRNRIKIYFNEILHLYIENMQAIHSWMFETEKLYYIEFIFDGGSTICDYDHKEYWIEILKQLDKEVF